MHSAISNLRIALYARSSPMQQGSDSAITRQLSELRQRIAEEGGSIDDEACFIDKGVSGASVARPALQRLRERAARGDLDRIYVLAPDRLARSSASLTQLTAEFTQAAAELIFLDPTASQQAWK
jgi:site-specific DNA recombinase